MSTQHLYGQRGKIRYMKKEAKNLKEDYIRQIKGQYLPHSEGVYEGEIEVYVTLYFDTKHRRDRDNYHKLSMDAMEGIIYKDDSQIIRAVVEKAYNKNNPGINVNILEYTPE